ncbi:MAG: hypothetical protein GY948_01735 [Alphaproteobacteria bacterium]|nr:hypothetical protein [Alphaproteobacteria bacterium]
MTDQQNLPEKSIVGVYLAAMMVLELIEIYTGLETLASFIRVLVLGLPLMALPILKVREYYLLVVSFVLGALVWRAPGDGWQALLTGLDRSAYLASFMMLMALLREGAITSPAVKTVGTYLTLQPPKRRFLALFSGSHFFSVLINLGSVSLLTPFIQRGVRGDAPLDAPLDEVQQIRERRQLAAVHRGFCWFLVWAPTAVTQAILPGLLTDIDAARLMALGFCMALVMLAVGWLEDTLVWAKTGQRLRASGQVQRAQPPQLPKRAVLSLALVCSGLIGLTVLAKTLGGVGIVSGVMLAAPIVVIIWVWAQGAEEASSDPSKAPLARYREIAFVSMPGFLREVVFISCAGFIGTAGAFLVPSDQLAALVEHWAVPGWLFMLGLSVSVLLAGHVALSPITMAVFLGSVVAHMPATPVDVTLCALAIAAGTAISSLGAPFASVVLMLSKASGYPTTTLTWTWNGLYTGLSVAALGLLYVAYTAMGV